MFEWDLDKAVPNRITHGVPFEQAAAAFGDPTGLDGADLAHSGSEPRRLRLAALPDSADSADGSVVVVAYTLRTKGHEEITRIISARAASRRERARYYSREG